MGSIPTKKTLNSLEQIKKEIVNSNQVLSELIADQATQIKELKLQNEKQINKLSFLNDEETTRKELSEQRVLRKKRLKNQKRKPLRDGAAYLEFDAAMSVISKTTYRSAFVQSRDRVSLLVLFLTGLRVSNLNLIRASNLKVFFSKENSCYFEVSSIKSRGNVVYRTLLTRTSLDFAFSYEKDIALLLENKNPTDLVFTPQNKKNALERAALTKRLNFILSSAGKMLGKNIKSHSFRIGHITVLIENFGLLQAQTLVGHSSPSTTLRYARNKLDLKDYNNKMHRANEEKFNGAERNF